MCSISGSFSLQKLSELVELNRYRGEHSHSFSIYDVNKKKFIGTIRQLGPIDMSTVCLPLGCYGIVHQQAPTTENKSMDTVHPAQKNENVLFHNGILKPKEIKRLKKKHKSKSTWDTELLLLDLIKEGVPLNIDGSFSCVYYDGNGELFLFRNSIAPMFEDSDLNISSTKFTGGNAIRPDTMYRMNFEDKKLDTTKRKFITMENPYWL